MSILKTNHDAFMKLEMPIVKANNNMIKLRNEVLEYMIEYAGPDDIRTLNELCNMFDSRILDIQIYANALFYGEEYLENLSANHKERLGDIFKEVA